MRIFSIRYEETVYPGCCRARKTIIFFLLALFFFLFFDGDLLVVVYCSIGAILISGRLLPQNVLPSGEILRVAI